mgnify:CR=1 FL=1
MENISADPSAFAYLTTLLPLFFLLAISVALAFIPATIARKKGYSQGLFWLFGFFLFLPAIIVACCIEDKTKPKPPTAVYVAQPYAQPYAPPAPSSSPSPVDELQRYKDLLDRGAISQEEYDAVKAKLLNKI